MFHFYPGGTPLQVFTLPFAAVMLTKAVVTYVQNGVTVLEKTATEFSDTESEEPECEFSYALTQEESLLFSTDECLMQVNVLKTNGVREVSEPFGVHCCEQLHREVMEQEAEE